LKHFDSFGTQFLHNNLMQLPYELTPTDIDMIDSCARRGDSGYFIINTPRTKKICARSSNGSYYAGYIDSGHIRCNRYRIYYECPSLDNEVTAWLHDSPFLKLRSREGNVVTLAWTHDIIRHSATDDIVSILPDKVADWLRRCRNRISKSREDTQ